MDQVKPVTKNAWNAFLLSPAGIEGMLYARESGPSITAKEQAGIILEAGVVQGYKMALDRITAFTEASVRQEVDLENNSRLG